MKRNNLKLQIKINDITKLQGMHKPLALPKEAPKASLLMINNHA
jgi:hypothetical protein